MHRGGLLASVSLGFGAGQSGAQRAPQARAVTAVKLRVTCVLNCILDISKLRGMQPLILECLFFFPKKAVSNSLQ